MPIAELTVPVRIAWWFPIAKRVIRATWRVVPYPASFLEWVGRKAVRVGPLTPTSR